ncbi:MAG: sigma 54-interacting transcriptional regulator [Dehalobacterium sp.]
MRTFEIKKELLKDAWESFVNQNIISSSVRTIVGESWKRSKSMGINPKIFKIQRMSPNAIENELFENRQLIHTSLSIMKNIFDFVQGTGFLISLSNKNGIILDIIGEDKIIKKAGTYVGDSWAEESVGTNSICLSLLTQSPIQVFAAEHYLKPFHGWTCSSAPIFDEKQNILGVLTMTGECDQVHLHTLGMVVAGVNAIENNLQAQKSLKQIAISNTYKTAIMESIDEGIIALNTDETVSHINNTAKRILKIDSPLNKIIGIPFRQVIGSSHPLCAKIENCFSVPNGDSFFIDEGSFTLTHKLIYSRDNSIIGVVLVLREMKMMKRLVNGMVGARARYTFNDIIGNNSKFKEAVKLAKAAANSLSNVLLLGESGTGKELFAQAIHNASVRRTGPFLGINCAALPRGLIESELFGYTEGAFTGAKKGGNPGKFELADGGTFLLDEIGEMPLDLQAILLRVLQENTIVRIGGKETIPINVRVIAATNKDLLKEVKAGNFRRDLYYRLNVLNINIPPLKERNDDISILAMHFLNNLNQRLNTNVKYISKKVLDIFSSYHWPGNIRELQNTLERAINITNGSTIMPESLPEYMYSSNNRTQKNKNINNLVTLKEYEKQLLTALLEEHNGNRAKVAKILEISRTTLYRKIDEYNIEF